MSHNVTPTFVITGAPNKGKSTFVKAMTNNPNVVVKSTAGTTVESKPYSYLKKDQEGNKKKLLTLWDTPGFENQAEVYEIVTEWKRESKESATEIISRYIETYKDDSNHKFEVEILKPLRQFACIVYVADCSNSFSEDDYLREIQLLKFTNYPRIAILNPIDGHDHIESWREGLREYFHTIKVFNPHTTTFNEKLSTLGALSHLHDEWEKPINQVIYTLREEREHILEESARIIRKTVIDIFDKEFEIVIDNTEDESHHKTVLLEKVRSFVKRKMNASQSNINSLFNIDVDIEILDEYADNDLFSETVRKNSLPPYQRGFIWALAGGTIGAIIDAAAGGLTFGIFTAILGSGAYAAGYFSDLKPSDLINIKKYLSSEKREKIRVNSLNPEIGLLVINRLRQVVASLYNRTAANTEKIIIKKDLDKKSLFKISTLLAKMAKSKKQRYMESNKRELLEFISQKLHEDQKI
jgi:GTPase Era involved in 16S rRNA processing